MNHNAMRDLHYSDIIQVLDMSHCFGILKNKILLVLKEGKNWQRLFIVRTSAAHATGKGEPKR